MVADFIGIPMMVYFILLFHIIFFSSNILIPIHDYSVFVLESKETERTREHVVLTAAYVEGVVLVQRPPSKVWGHQLKAMHQSSPPLPLDGPGARLVLVTDRN